MSTERVKTKRLRVLVSAGQASQFNPLRKRYQDISFDLIDGRKPRQVQSVGNYDLVICCKWTDHSVYHKFVDLYGRRVRMVNGSLSSVAREIDSFCAT